MAALTERQETTQLFVENRYLHSLMCNLSDQYRQMAAKARRDAAAAKLPNVQHLHLQSANRLDQIAQGIESVAQAKARNEAAKVAYPTGT